MAIEMNHFCFALNCRIPDKSLKNEKIQKVFDYILNTSSPCYEFLQDNQKLVKPYFDVDLLEDSKPTKEYVDMKIKKFKNIIIQLFQIQNETDIFCAGSIRPKHNQYKLSIHFIVNNHTIGRSHLNRIKNKLKDHGFDPSIYSTKKQKFRCIGAPKDNETAESVLFPYENGMFKTSFSVEDFQKSCVQYILDDFFHIIDESSDDGSTMSVPEHKSIQRDFQNAFQNTSEADFNVKLTQDQMKTLLFRLKPKFSDDRELWLKVGSALKHEGFPMSLFDRFSQRSVKYGNVKDTWSSLNRNGQCKIGTLMKFLKESDQDHFDFIINKSKNKIDDKFSALSGLTSASTSVDHMAVAIKLFSMYCTENGYAFNGNTVYKKKHEIFYTPVHFSEKIQDDITELIKNKVFVSTDSVSALWVLAKPNKISDLAKCTSVPVFGFRKFDYNRNIVAFLNGFLDVVEWIFSYYKDGVPENVFAKQFFDVEFDLTWLNGNWQNIPTPNYDKIWKCQVKCKDALEVAYGLLGQLHFPMNDNNFQVCMYIKGTPNSGKSTSIDPIRNMFPEEKIGTFDHKQKVFGMASLCGKYVCIDNDTPHDMVTSIGKTEFQKLISGEHNVIPVKNSDSWQGILDCRTLICSNYMQDIREAGEIQRRLAVFLFSPLEGGDSSLPGKIKKETPYLFIKTVLAYHELKKKYKNLPFNKWDIDYFDSQTEEALFNNNPIYKFIVDSAEFSIVDGSQTPWIQFEVSFKEKNRNYKLKTTDQTFAKLGLRIDKINCCKGCGKKHVKGCCLQYKREYRAIKRVIINLTIS
jgi:hypothetical protein